MEFNDAVDVLTGPPVIISIAEAAGVAPGTVSRARMVAGDRRSPPKGWRLIVRRFALERAAALSALAAELADA